MNSVSHQAVFHSLLNTYIVYSNAYSVGNWDPDLRLILHFIAGVMWKPFLLGRGIQITRATDLGELKPWECQGAEANVRQKQQTSSKSTPWETPERRRLQIQNPVLTEDKSRKHFSETEDGVPAIQKATENCSTIKKLNSRWQKWERICIQISSLIWS